MAWNPQAHPRAAAGTAGGGQFAPAGSGTTSTAAKGAKGKQPARDTRPTPGNANPVGYGERGQRVNDLQKRLNALGAKPPLKLDGIFGPKTRAAVVAFQKAHGLKPDGLVGPLTTKALRTPAHKAHPAHAAHHTAAHARHHAASHHAARAPAKPAAKPDTVKPGTPKPVAKLAAAKVPAKPAARALEIIHGAERALAHEPIGRPGGPGVYGMKGKQYPAYFQHIRNDLMEKGTPEGEAHRLAWGILRNFAAGHDGHGNRVHPDTVAKAQAALAELKRLGAEAKASRTMDEITERATASTAEINNLPDSDFAYIEPGGTKDSQGKTVPRSKRHLPIHDSAHIRNALARLPQTDIPAAAKAAAFKKIRSRAKGAGVEVSTNTATASRSGELFRLYPLEDCQIITRAQGDGSGCLVEAYATVFDVEAEIRDHQGHYKETIDRAAFDDVLGRIRRSRGGFPHHVKVLYNHGKTATGIDAPEFQVPLGVPEEIRPEARGLLTRTRYDRDDPFTERILSKIRSQAITAQSFVGAIIRSDPPLRGPGDRYRGRGGVLQTVRRMTLGLREYGPVLWPAYTGAEILGVRMQLPGDAEDLERFEDDDAPDTPGDVEYDLPSDEDVLAVAGADPGESDGTRYHQHALYRIRSAEIRERVGLDWDE